MSKPTAEEAVKVMSDFVNNMSLNEKEFAVLMSQEHRTLQQSFTNVCLAWMRELASKNEGQYDLRNEQSVKVAKEIIEKVEFASYKLSCI